MQALDQNSNPCLGCQSILPHPFLDLGKMPLANAYIKPGESHHPEPTYPLSLTYCNFCKLVQLCDLVPPEKMFSEYLYFSSYSDTFLDHAEKMAKDLTSHLSLNTNSRVVEIASNDGYLLKYFLQMGIQVLGIEPAINIAEIATKRGIPTINKFFNPRVAQEIIKQFGQADLIIGNNVLAHVPKIIEFLESVKACLSPGALAVFEFPYLGELLDKTAFDTIYHEHVFYLSATAVNNLALRAGLQLIDVSHQPVHGGSLRVFLKSGSSNPSTAAVGTILSLEDKLGITAPDRFATFSRDVMLLKRKLIECLVKIKKSGGRLAAYGAPAKGSTLLNYCGIGKDLLEFTVDRNPHKQSLLMPGSHLPIRPPEDLIKIMPDYTLILPWNISDEIISQQREYTKNGGKFIIPIPKARIV